VPAPIEWSPLVSGGRVDLERNGATQRAGMTGTGIAAPRVIGQSAAAGEYFSDEDIRTRARVVLVGNTVKEQLFGADDPLGQLLTVGSQVYVVKGVLSKLGADPHGGDLDNVVAVPYTTVLQIAKRDDLGSVRFRVQPGTDVEAVAALVRTAMRTRHNLGEGRVDDFYVATAPAGRAAFDQFEQMFRTLLPVITGVLFLIALLVIASLMLISVKERSAEIGLRKALGARARDIERQFLIETLLVALLGGALGIALSYPGALYVESLYARYGSAVSFRPTPAIIVLSLLCAVITGALAAWLPARRAATLNPVEALR
jgi:ABC-type antimicrobial peptide transport system permease subunit